MKIIKIFLSSFLLIFLFSCISNSKKFQISADEILNEIISKKDLISAINISEIILNKKEKYQFIDIRSSQEFGKSHIENAINIPMENILDEKYYNFLNQDKKINILYHTNFSQSNSVCLLLKQIGYKNNKVMECDYELIEKFVIEKFSPMYLKVKDEKAKYNFAKIVNEKSGNKKNTAKKTKKKAIKKRKKKEIEGGC
ncbi:MAG: hypothetical protein B6I24_11155 [Bacteroidetes bacterium 4572_128]|nr:MAG: hypothetical protein B6I24_11155 [Bacteroidetes bacterium 4572_128]